MIEFLQQERGVQPDVVAFLMKELQITSVSDLANYWTLDSYEAGVDSDVVAHIDVLKSKQAAKVQVARLRAAWKMARQKNAAELMGIRGKSRQPRQDLAPYLMQRRVDSAVIAHMKENLLMETVDDFVHYWTASDRDMAPIVAQVEPFRNMLSSERFTSEVARLRSALDQANGSQQPTAAKQLGRSQGVVMEQTNQDDDNPKKKSLQNCLRWSSPVQESGGLKTPLLHDPPLNIGSDSAAKEDLDSVHFFATVNFGEEGDDFVEVQVVRSGALDGVAVVQWETADSFGGKAGLTYTAAQGTLTFDPGQCCANIRVHLLDDSQWQASAEFKIRLSNPQGCKIDTELGESRVKIIDDDIFPSNKYLQYVEGGEEGILKIPTMGLIFRFSIFCMRVPGVFWRVVTMVVFDQLHNLYQFLKTYLINIYMVDVVYKTGVEREELWLSTPQDTAMLVGVLFLAPMLLTALWDRTRANLDVAGTLRGHLQGGAFCRYMNCTAKARQHMPSSLMGQVILSDAAQVVDAGFMKMFGCVNVVIKLVIVTAFVYVENPSAIWVAIMFPLCMAMWQCCRKESSRSELIQMQYQFVKDCSSICNFQSTLAAYNWRGNVAEFFSKKIEELNELRLPLELYDVTNECFPQWISMFFTVAYIACFAPGVLQGALEAGTFIAMTRIFTEMGKEFGEGYEQFREMIETSHHLKKLVWVLNAETDLVERREVIQATVGETKSSLLSLSTHAKSLDALHIKVPGQTFEHARISSLQKPWCLKVPAMELEQGTLTVTVGGAESGKATLLNMLQNSLRSGEGCMVQIPSHLKVLHVDGNPKLLPGTLWQNLNFGNRKAEIGHVLSILRLLEGAEVGDAPTRLEQILHVELGSVDEEEEDEHFSTGSSDWATRVTVKEVAIIHLARALISDPDIMLIDDIGKHFQSDQAQRVLKVLSEYVRAPNPKSGRRRTVVVSSSHTWTASEADLVLRCSQNTAGTESTVEPLSKSQVGVLMSVEADAMEAHHHSKRRVQDFLVAEGVDSKILTCLKKDLLVKDMKDLAGLNIDETILRQFEPFKSEMPDDYIQNQVTCLRAAIDKAKDATVPNTSSGEAVGAMDDDDGECLELVADSWARNTSQQSTISNTDSASIIQFMKAGVYALEDGGAADMIVMRTGNTDAATTVTWQTEDSSAKAGVAYIKRSAHVKFFPGQVCASIKVATMPSSQWSPTLECKVRLTGADNGAKINPRFATCRVRMLNQSVFPSTKYQHEVKGGEAAIDEISTYGLIYSFFTYCLNIEGILWKSLLILFFDQLHNLQTFMRTYLISIYLLDVVFNPNREPDELWLQTPEQTAWCVAVLLIVIQVMTSIWDRKKVKMDVAGELRSYLQEGLFRHYLYYTKEMAESIPAVEIGRAMLGEIADVINVGFMKVFNCFSSVVHLVIVAAFVLHECPSAIWVVVAFSATMVFWFSRRSDSTEDVLREEKQVLKVCTALSNDYELYASYRRKVQAADVFTERVESLNELKLPHELFDLTEESFPEWVAAFFTTFYIMYFSHDVFAGVLSVGTFIALVRILNEMGEEFAEGYVHFRKLVQTAPALRRIVVYLNAETEVWDKKVFEDVNQAETYRRLLESRVPCEAANSLPIIIPKLTFSYGSPSLMDVTWSLSTEEIEIQQGTLTALMGGPKTGKATLLKLMANKCRGADSNFAHVYVPAHLSTLYVSEEPVLLPFSLWRNLTMGRLGQKQERVLNILRRIEGWHEGLEERVLNRILESELSQSTQDEEESDGKWRRILTNAERSYVHLARALIMNPDFLLMNHPTKHFGIHDAGLIGKVLREQVHNGGLFEEPGRIDRPRTVVISCDQTWITGLADVGLLVSRNAAGTRSTVKKLDAREMEVMASDEMKIMGHH